MGERLDTSIFTRTRTADEAKRARKLEGLYHVGQQKIWDGREVLDAAIARHGSPAALPIEKKRALAAIVSGLMWGELAAWRISAQLADRSEHFEAKLAATSQAHDEARHFYVLHDYLERLEIPLPELDTPTKSLIEVVLGAPDLGHKMIGMQLFIESIALTIFKALGDRVVCPVLDELLRFIERDEARHVGFGVQGVPDLVKSFGLRKQLELDAFQVRILAAALGSLRSVSPHLRALGIDPRDMAEHGLHRMRSTVELLAEANGRSLPAIAGPFVSRFFEASIELMFPRDPSLRGRLFGASRALIQA
jgi:hypothetical protein